MALGVSRFPETVNIPSTIVCGDSSRDDSWMLERERVRDTKKYKGSFRRLFSRKAASDSKERGCDRDKEQQYRDRLRVKSFHPFRSPPPSDSLPVSPIERVRTIETSTPTLPHVSGRRPKPRPPQLTIPVLTSSQSQPDLIFPPTPKLIDITTRDTIKALGLAKQLPTLPPRILLTNPVIFGDGVPTFPAGSPSYSTPASPCSMMNSGTSGSFAEPKSTPVSSPWSAGKPLPPIPTQQPSSPPSFTRPSASFSGNNSGAAVRSLPQSKSLHTGADGQPARSTPPIPHSRGRRRPPPLRVIIPTYKHKKTVLLVSPQSPKENRSRKRKVTRDIPTAAKQVAVPVSSSAVAAPPPAVVIVLPTPAVGDEEADTVVRPLESQPDRSVSSDLGSNTSHSVSTLPGPAPAPVRPLHIPGKRVRGPRGPRLQDTETWIPPDTWSGPSSPQPAPPRGRKKSQKGPGSTKKLEKLSGSIKGKSKGLAGRGKSASRAQDGVQKQRPFLVPMNTSMPSLNGTRTPDAWAEEDKERSAVDPRASFGDGGRSRSDSLQPASTLVSDAQNVLRADETFVTTSKSNEPRGQSLDFREVISQLRE